MKKKEYNRRGEERGDDKPTNRRRENRQEIDYNKKNKKTDVTAKVKPFVTVAVYRALTASKEKNRIMQEKE